MKILVTIEQFNPEAKKILEQNGEVVYSVLDEFELEEAIGNYDAVIVGLQRLDKKVLAKASNLKFIATATTGTDHIDVVYAKENGIQILNLEGDDLREITGTAELAFGLLLVLMGRIFESFEDVKKGNWRREKFPGHNLHGKTLGIVGLGRLGSMVAQYGKAFGMRVIAYGPFKDTSENARLVDFEILLSDSDIISIHAPLNEETAGMFSEKIFKKMKNSAYLINTSRGAIVNEDDLLKALQKKIIAGYAADVLGGETEFGVDAAGHPLVKFAEGHSNVIITPHIGGFRAESRAATDIIIAEKIVKALS